MSDLRIVVDTNVLISGLFGVKDSPSSQVLNAYRSQRVILITSPAILREVNEVINRDRIVKLTGMSSEQRIDFMDKLIERVDVTSGKSPAERISRDIKDDKFLSCAVEGEADYIITGDEDLLVLQEYQGVKIITPREFLKVM